MIIVLLRFSFKEGSTPAHRDAALAAMRRTSQVESTAFSFVGPDLGDPADGYTHGYCVAIADLAALERYMYDPVHLEGDPEILPHLARLSQIRLSDDPDPALAEKIAAMHREKLAAYPTGNASSTRSRRPDRPDGTSTPTRPRSSSPGAAQTVPEDQGAAMKTQTTQLRNGGGGPLRWR
jgi:hypothetical protein